MFDLVRYLERIQVAGPIDTDLASLARLQLAHLKAVPFENLDIHYGRPISLGAEEVFEKIVLNKRGGFCYELNSLFCALLSEIGFETKIVSARGVKRDGGLAPEFDHLAIVVSIGGMEYLSDVGFGRFAITPLQIGSGLRVSDGVGEFQIDNHDDSSFIVNRIELGQSEPEYLFTNTERRLSEFEEMCSFHQQSPDSHFSRNKLISVLTDDGRITLTDTQLKISGPNSSRTEDFEPSEFEYYLKTHFGIDMAQPS